MPQTQAEELYTMSKEELPADPDSLAQVRLIEARVQGESEKIALQIEAHNKSSERLYHEVEKSRQAAESAAEKFGGAMKWGVGVGLILLFVALFYSMTPILEGVVREVADRYDWDEKVATAARVELQKRLTTEALAQAIDDGAIQNAANTVVQSNAFRIVLQAHVENAVRDSVTSSVNDIIAENQVFQSIVNEQLQAEQNRLQAAIKTHVPVMAEDKAELTKKILATVADYDSLGRNWMNIDVYPFDDVLHIRARLIWEPERPEDQRLRIRSLTFEGMTATTPGRRQAVEEYLGHAVPASVNVTLSNEADGKKFVTGEFRTSEAANHSNYEAASRSAVESIIGLVDDCFNLDFPTTWRVSVGQ